MLFQDIKNGRFYLGDCLEVMKDIPDGVVDMILCDLPYGTTACKWDTIIPFELLWKEYERVIKPNGAIVLFGSEPFSSKLRCSNLPMFRYDWIWDKIKAGNIAQSGYQPLKVHEIISVFSKNKHYYSPQKVQLEKPQTRHLGKKSINRSDREDAGGMGGEIKYSENYEADKKLPVSIQTFQKDNYRGNCLHPTQKPVALFEYLLKTYTNENELVLDNCAGSGTTAIACENTNRKWICIEKDEEYANKAVTRIITHNITPVEPAPIVLVPEPETFVIANIAVQGSD